MSSSHESRRSITRIGWGAGAAMGIGFGTALGVALDDMAVGLIMGISIMFVSGLGTTGVACRRPGGRG